MTLNPADLVRPTTHAHAKRRTHLRGWLLGRGFHQAAEAMTFAEQWHDGTRKDGTTPEFAHQTYIVSYLTTLLPHMRFPEATLTTAFLHDVCEDYPVSFEEIEGLFGAQVMEAVIPLTKEYQGRKVDPSVLMQEQAKNPISSLVKPGDRINNQQTAPGVFRPEKIASYVEETKTYILPMLKQARRTFPDQDLAYQNQKTVLWAQIEMLEAALAGLVESRTNA